MMKLTVLALAAAPLLVSAESANDAWMQQTNLLEKTSSAQAANLPNVLVLGDSISMGYTPFVKKRLAGVANVSRPAANCGASWFYFRGRNGLKDWLGTNRWDVITVNFGCWDYWYNAGDPRVQKHYWSDKAHAKLPPLRRGTAIREAGFTLRTTLPQYEDNLRRILAVLKGTGARIVFAYSTPCPSVEADDRCSYARAYNEVAGRVCAAMNVGVVDLYSVAERQYGEIKDGAHFTDKGNDVLAEEVCRAIRRELGAADVVETAKWQGAIDAASAQGGGVVSVPAGLHVVGTLELKSNVELRLEDGATLLASARDADFPPRRTFRTPSQGDERGWGALLCAEGATNIAVTGRGTVWGRGDRRLARNILFASCRGVTVRDIRLRSPGVWNQHYFDCEDVRIENVDVFARSAPGNDGVDIDSCRRVTVRACTVDSEDDAIVLKSTSLRPCEDVLVEDCQLSTQATAFKLGTESLGGFRRVKARNLWIGPSPVKSSYNHPINLPTGIAAIEISTVDGGDLEDVDVDGVDVTGTECVLYVRAGKRCRPLRTGGEGLKPGFLRRVRVANVTARDVGNLGASVTGFERGRVDGVTLEHIRIAARGGVGAKDYRPFESWTPKWEGYPSPYWCGPVPAKGLFTVNAGNLKVADFVFSSEKPDVRPERMDKED